MPSKLESFLSDQKIDSRRVLSASNHLERLRPEDRAIKLVQSKVRKSDGAKLPEGLGKPRSGRPVTAVMLSSAMAGGSVSGPAKHRILRAVNHVLGQRKKDEVQIDTLFDVPPAPVAKPKAEEPAAEEAAAEEAAPAEEAAAEETPAEA